MMGGGGGTAKFLSLRNQLLSLRTNFFQDFFRISFNFWRRWSTLESGFHVKIVFFRACGARQVPSPPSPTAHPIITTRITPHYQQPQHHDRSIVDRADCAPSTIVDRADCAHCTFDRADCAHCTEGHSTNHSTKHSTNHITFSEPHPESHPK